MEVNDMTYLQYWEQRFPEFMAKTSKWERSLLSTQDPSRVGVLDEKDLANRLTLLKDFEVKRKEGKLIESTLYQKASKELEQFSESNLIKNGFSQAGATALITVGLSTITNYPITSASLITAGIGLAILGRAKWGVGKTQRHIWDTMVRKFALPDSEELKVTSIVSARQILRILVLVPACSIVAMVTGLLTAEVADLQLGYGCSIGGVIALVIDLIVMKVLSK